MNIIIKLLHFFNILPKEGSNIKYVQKLQFETIVYNGVLHYHEDGKRAYIKTNASTLCCIDVKHLI